MARSILLLNHHLKEYAGSELVTLDLARTFRSMSWDVTVATFFSGHPVKDLFESEGIKVCTILNETMESKSYDVVWGHHFPIITKCLVDDGVGADHLILSSLSPYEPLETLPLFADESDAILSISQENMEEMNLYGIKSNIILFPNSAPERWWSFYREAGKDKIERIAVISNHPPAEILSMGPFCNQHGIIVDFYGIDHHYTLITPELLSDYDAVITIGRTVQHAMALGVPVFCYDRFGGPGWITLQNYETAEWFNYSGRCTRRKLSPEALVGELVAGYPSACKCADYFKDVAFKRYNLEQNVTRVLNLLACVPVRKRVHNSAERHLASKLNKTYLSTLRMLYDRERVIAARDLSIAAYLAENNRLQLETKEMHEAVAVKYRALEQKEALLRRSQHENRELLLIKKASESLQAQLDALQLQRAALESKATLLQQQLSFLENALGWRLIKKYRSLIDRLFPAHSGRRRFYELAHKGMRILIISGPIALAGRLAGRNRQARSRKGGMAALPERLPGLAAIVIDQPVDAVDVAVSVIIPTKNAGDGFRRLLSMLRSQRGIRQVEIVVVDSGSTDNTLEMARQFDARIIQIEPGQFSHSFARNLGAENAAGEYLLFTVQDALPPSDLWLYELYGAIARNGVAAVSCAESPRDDADLFYRAISWNHYRFLEVLDRDRILSKPGSDDHVALRKNGQLSDLACLIAREIFMKYKYSGDYAEDLELGIKLVKDGYKIAFLSSVRILHSHNRPAYYFLKRGFVDNLFLARIFPDYSYAHVSAASLFPDILHTYNALASIVRQKLSLEVLPCKVGDFAAVVKRSLGDAARSAYSYGAGVAGNQYLDADTVSFVLNLGKNCDAGKNGAAYDGTLIPGLRNYAGMMLEYMKDTYELIDGKILEDFKASLCKAYAIVCGAQLACCYLTDFGGKREMIENIAQELRSGV